MVSIHAPTRGATHPLVYNASSSEVSIHAPTRGATAYTQRYPSVERVSIHAPTRGETYAEEVVADAVGVSIHAPTRGATAVFRTDCAQAEFQSTHPLGVRQSSHVAELQDLWFQSTHPLGVRLEFTTIKPIIFVVSIHAPTRGATFVAFLIVHTFECFNPRTHSGCDCIFSNRLNITMQR